MLALAATVYFLSFQFDAAGQCTPHLGGATAEWYVQVGSDVGQCDAWDGPYLTEEEALDQAYLVYSVEDEGSPFNEVNDEDTCPWYRLP